MEIQEFQQNREPWLFVDEITECVPNKYAKGHKTFKSNEWFFAGHFADDPNVPGTIQIEVLLQVFLMTFLTIPEYKGKKTNDTSIQCKFKRKILPNERIDVEATLTYFKRGIAQGNAVGYINDEIACEAKIEMVVPDVLEKFKPRKLDYGTCS